MTIPRGSFATSIRKLATETGLTVKQVRIALDKLCEGGEVGTQRTHKYTIVSVCKYEDYQCNSDNENKQEGTQRAHKGHTLIEEEKKEYIYNTSKNNNAHTHTRDWRFVSSVQRDILGFDKDKIAEYKREVFREQVELLAPQVKMTPKQVDAFVRFWTEHSPGNENLRADLQPTFDIRDRMLTWKEREKPDVPKVGTPSPPESRMDALEKDLNFIHEFYNGKEQQDTTPDEQ